MLTHWAAFWRASKLPPLSRATYNGRNISALAVPANAGDAKREWETLLLTFNIEEVVKAEMPDGATEISQPGRWAARMRQVWEAIIQVHQVQQSIKSEGTEGIKLDELLDVSDIMISGIGFGIS